MALLLRVVTKPKWVSPSWMAAGEVPADVLSDLRATSNELSVWSIQLDHSDLNTALAAVASNRERLEKLDYTLLDEAILPSISIRCVASEGVTAHPSANATMHRDLIELTVQKVARLAHEMMPLKRVRVSEKQVKSLLLNALQSGALNRDRIVPKLLSELEPTITGSVKSDLVPARVSDSSFTVHREVLRPSVTRVEPWYRRLASFFRKASR